jgi:hypothetical protein
VLRFIVIMAGARRLEETALDGVEVALPPSVPLPQLVILGRGSQSAPGGIMR